MKVRRLGDGRAISGRAGFADLLGQHEADVLADHVRAPRRHRRRAPGRTRRAPARGSRARSPPRRCRRRACPVKPLLAHFAGVVDQVRLGAAIARHLDQAHRVRRVARADHEHQIAAAGHLLDGRLAVGGRVADVVRAGTDDLREALAQAGDDRARLVDREGRLRDVGDPLRVLRPPARSTSCSLCTSTIRSGASPIVPSTSSWPSWPTSTIV